MLSLYRPDTLRAAASRRAAQSLAATSALAICLAAGAASAQAPPPAAGGDVRNAAQAFDSGNRQFARRDYAGAATWYETADRLAPNAVALQSAIRAHREANTPDHIARAATLALRLRERDPSNAQSIAAADRAVRELSPQLGRVTVRCDRCEIEVDHVLQPGLDVFVAPGRHTLTAHFANDRNREQIVEVAAGATQDVTLEPPAAEVAAVPNNSAGNANQRGTGGGNGTAAGSSSALVDLRATGGVQAGGNVDAGGGGLHPAFFITGLALTAVAGGGAAYFWVNATSDGRRLIDEATATQMGNDALRRQVENGELYTTVALVSTGVLGAATITALIFTRWGGRPRRNAVEVAPTAGLGGVTGLTLSGRF